MKLGSKITMGTLLFLLTALIVCCNLILSVSKKTILDRMVNDTVTEVEELEDHLMRNRGDMEGVKDALTANSLLKYCFFKQTQYADAQTEYVLAQEQEMIYNNSGINTAAILDMENPTYETKRKMLQLADENYVVAGRNIIFDHQTYQIYVVRTITEVFRQIRRLIAVCIGIGLGVCIMVGISIVLFLRHSFRPLEQLRDEANAISQGEYGERIEIRGRDELASLSKSFNRMAESVEQHIAEVEKTSEARNRLIHALSHEMRTPVTAICGYAYALRSVKMDREQQAEALEFIDLEAKRLKRLSDKLTGLVGLSSQNVPLQEIKISEIKNQLEMILSGKEGVKLETEEGSLIGDKDLLLMLITNLCDNARKAGATEIRVKVSPNGIWVKDNGKGIPKEEQEHIFEAFYQGDASRNQEGFGLGLTLCQKIAELHHTKLCVESQPGMGTTFYLYNSFTGC